MEYDEETLKLIQQMEAERESEKLKTTNLQNSYGQLSMYQSINPNNLAELQLDLSKEKALIEHTLRGHILKRADSGAEYWDTTADVTRRIFSEYGVDRLMNFINIYVSLNIILSYYLPEEVMAKMKIISDELADIFYLEYEHIFYKPKISELVKAHTIDKEDVYSMDGQQLEKLTKELEFEAEMLYAKNKKQVFMIHNMLVNAVHSAYNRALWGKERDSLRKMMHISESNSPTANQNMGGSRQTNKFKWFNPNSW